MNDAMSMFRELGFKLYNSAEDFYLYKYETDYDKVFIRFDLKLKNYNVICYRFVDNTEPKFVPMHERPQNIKHSSKYGHWQSDTAYNIDIKLHNAIHQQMKELQGGEK